MNELIPIQKKDGIETVNARELHSFLESKQEYAHWIKSRIEKYEFMEGKEFMIILSKTPEGGRPKKEYYISIDMAKELSMVENNQKGQEARRYFIEVEKKYKQKMLPEDYASALRELADRVERVTALEAQAQIDRPKVEFYEAVTDSTDAIDIGTMAKVLNMGIGRNNIFKILREQQILMANNIPYQRYIDSGWFRTIEQKFSLPDGSTRINIKTVVYQKGVDEIRKLLGEYNDSE